ncbi:enoyl-CoA hydratase [Jeotgalibacillus malaysiensis]|uniref:Enoyl-CoA hydratase n=1 Tax=Jeotgalibacillus malaysiensis TaxID=1508404 RepID=A0A0B5APQ0_9BACL|nr:enoyl-CoA hydratase [Jeotgalibacillus malaysiensis]AJD90647.1 enoyl-CoA hydratase [Jeotgalibacillus malaysiensis]
MNKHYETLKVEVQGNTVWLTLNRPESLNALNLQLMTDLQNALNEIKREADLQVLVLSGEGKGFCSGGDIKAMLKMNGEEEFQHFMKIINDLSVTLYTMPKITVSAIHGAAAGLGLSLALSTDVIIAEEQSKLAMNFIGIGLVPDGGGHFFMQERLGTQKALHTIWRGDILNGHEAYSMGLIDKVTAEGRVKQEAEAFVQTINHSPVKAMMESKSILRASRKSQLEQVLEMEKEAQWKMRQTNDHIEGIQAFTEKRKPVFKGN